MELITIKHRVLTYSLIYSHAQTLYSNSVHAGDMSSVYHTLHNLGICQRICCCKGFFSPKLPKNKNTELTKARDGGSTARHKHNEILPQFDVSTTTAEEVTE